MHVYAGEQPVGETTSGTFSPTKKVGIALALIDTAAGLADGDLVEVDIRGRRTEARLVKPPFVQTSVR
jgi:aminomethyltransferase